MKFLCFMSAILRKDKQLNKLRKPNRENLNMHILHIFYFAINTTVGNTVLFYV